MSTLLVGCGQPSYSVDELLARAAEFEERGNLAAASIELKNAIQKDPNSAESRYRLGMVSLRLGDVRSAAHELGRARELGIGPERVLVPLLQAWHEQARYDSVLEESANLGVVPESQHADLLAARGMALLGKGDTGGGESAFREALTHAPNHEGALVGMARVALFGRDDLAETQTWLDRALAAAPDSEKALELLGDVEQVAGNLTEAEAAYSRALESAPTAVSARVKRAHARVYLQDFEGAEQDAETIGRSFRNHPAVSHIKGLIAFRQARYADARTEFETVLAENPEYMPAVFHLGASHVALGNPQQADTYLGRFLAAYPQSSDAARMLAMVRMGNGQLEQAERLVRNLQERSPDDADLEYLMGNIAIARGNREDALVHLQRVVALRPDDARAQAALGTELLRAGEHEEGLRQLESAAARAPDLVELDVTLIVNLIRAGELDKAAVAIEQLRMRLPEDPLPDNLEGIVALALDDSARAGQAFRQALELAPGDPVATLNLGLLARREGDPDRAREWYRTGLDHHPENLDLLMQAARLESDEGQGAAMAALLEQAAARNPQAPEPRMALAQYLVETGQAQRALEALASASPANRQQEILHLDLTARAHLAAGQPEQALTSLRRLASLIPDRADARAGLAAAFVQAGSVEDAQSQVRRALALEPAHPRASQLLAQIGQGAAGTQNREALLARARELQQQSPNDPRGFAFEGRIQAGQGNHVAAARAYRSAYELSPTADFAIVLGLTLQRAGLAAEAMDLYRQHLAQHGEDARVLGALGEAQVNARDFAGAVSSLERVVELLPNHAAAHFLLARAYAGAGDAASFRSALDRTVRLDPDHLSAGMTRVRLDLEEGLVEQARRHHEELLQANPEHPEVLALGGEVALRDGRAGDAAAAYRQALEYRADTGWAMQAAQALSIDGRHAEAAAMLETWLEQRPADLGVRYVLGELYLALGERDAARAAFAEVVEQRPDNFVAMNNLAWLLREEDRERALRLAERAHSLAPDNTAIMNTLGTILLEVPGGAARAVTMFRQAAEATAGDPSARYHLAAALARNGERGEAAAILTELLAEGREFPEIDEARSLLGDLGS